MMNHIEKACNKLPSPGIIFLFLFALTAVLSLILGLAGVAVKHPASGEVLQVRSFFSRDGLYWFLEHMISNFTSFAPLGLVLVMTAAVGFCEESGLIENLLRSKQLFAWTRIDTLLAVGGADFLKSTGFTGFGMIAVFILLSGFINIFISSATAKWSILAPVSLCCLPGSCFWGCGCCWDCLSGRALQHCFRVISDNKLRCRVCPVIVMITGRIFYTNNRKKE